jgi:transposase
MIIIGVDFHPEFQQIALVDTETGEFQEKRLGHREEAETFYRTLAGQKVRVGMEASGHARWFERVLAELQLELWMETQSRSALSEYANGKRIVRMRN